MTVGQVIAKLGVDPKEYEKGLRQAERQADKAGSKIGSIFKQAFSVTLGMGMFEALKRGIKSTVGAAVDFNSMLQTAKIGFTTMLGSAERAQTFLDDMAKFAAKTPFEYPELLGAAKRMLAYGFAAENVLPTLRAVGDAAAALGTGGEGIDRIVLALGQIQAKGKLSAEEMRQLTEVGIPAWHMLAEAMGTTVPTLQDMVSKGLVPGSKAVEILTAGMTQRFGGMMASMENTWQGVTSSIKDIWRMTVGTLTETLFGGLNNMLIQFRDFLQQFYNMLQSIMGKKAKQSTSGLVQGTKEQAAAINEVAEATENASKKANKNFQAFDEIHQLQKETENTAAGGDLAGLSSTGLSVAPLQMDDMEEPVAVTKMQQAFEKLKDALRPAIEAFTRLKNAAEPVIQNIGAGLRWFYDNVLVPLGGWVISEAVPAFLNLLAGALRAINPVIEALKPLGQWLWDNLLLPIAEWTGGVILDILDGINKGLTAIGDWISANQKTVETLAIIVGSFAAAWWLVNTAVSAWNVIAAIATGVTSALGAAIGFLTSPIGIVIMIIGALIAAGVLLWRNWDTIKEWAGKLGEGIKDIFGKIGQWIGNTWNKVRDWTNKIRDSISSVKDTIIKRFGEIKTGLSNGWEAIKNIFSKVPEWFKSQFTKAWTNVKNVFSAGGKIFTGIKEGIADTFKTIVNGLINGINKIIKKPFETINKMLNKIRDISVMGIEPFKKLWKQDPLPIPQIPQLATGGYVRANNPMLAIIGDNRREGEIVSPESKIYEQVMRALRDTGASDRPILLTVQLGNTKIYKELIKGIKNYERQTGISLVSTT